MGGQAGSAAGRQRGTVVEHHTCCTPHCLTRTAQHRLRETQATSRGEDKGEDKQNKYPTHLHFQAYWWATPFAVEVAATAPLPPLPPREVVAGDGNNNSARFGVAPASLTAPRVSTTVGYPARALVFEATRGDLDGLAAALGDACTRLAAANVPHNVFVVDCGQRAFLFPNLFGTHKANGTVPEDLLETQVDPACFELAGHMVFKRRGDFHDLREDEAYNLVWRLLAAATPEPEEFARIVRIALAI